MKGLPFLLVALVVAVLDIGVPYLLLASTGSFWASFLFWCAITLAMIVFAGFSTRTWRDQ
ncbi:MAG: hypothetical protein ACOC0E_01635 [Spirochaetota bacterium]